MTDRELMQQALYALEYASDMTKPENMSGCGCPICVTITALRERLAQPEQEPVAWMHTSIKDNVIAHRPADLKRHPERWTALYPAPSPCPTCEALARTVMMDQTGYDPRPWVGLTDEEVSALQDFAYADDVEFVRHIEAKLKEKNT